MSADDAAPRREGGRSVVFANGSGYSMKLREGVAFADVVAWAQRATRAYLCKAERIETEDPERVVSDGLAFFDLTEDEDRSFGIYAMRCFSGLSVLSCDLSFHTGDTTLYASTTERSRLRAGCKPLELLRLV